MKQLVQSAGFPSGVVNVVTGDASVGHALLVSGRIDRISFPAAWAWKEQLPRLRARSLFR